MRIAAAAALSAAMVFASSGGGAHAAFDPDDDRGVRVGSEALFGVLGGTAGFFTGGLLGYGVCALAGEDTGMFGCLAGAIIGGAAFGFAGIGLGVYGGGDIAGGNGGLGWTFLGETGGVAVTALIALAAEVDVAEVPGFILLVSGPLVGAILGYELSTTHEGPRTIGTSLTFSF